MLEARERYSRLDQRARHARPWLRAWHLLATCLAVLGSIVAALLGAAAGLFQPGKTLCRGPRNPTLVADEQQRREPVSSPSIDDASAARFR
jgi:hypothetical protein